MRAVIPPHTVCGRFRGYDVRPQSSVPGATNDGRTFSQSLGIEDEDTSSDLGKPDGTSLHFNYDQVDCLAVMAPLSSFIALPTRAVGSLPCTPSCISVRARLAALCATIHVAVDPALRRELLLLQVASIRLRELSAALHINLAWYNSSDGADGAIASGAYIFRCNSITESPAGRGQSTWSSEGCADYSCRC